MGMGMGIGHGAEQIFKVAERRNNVQLVLDQAGGVRGLKTY
jgi:hypothetical protein